MGDFITWLKNPLGTDSGKPSGTRLFIFIGFVLVCVAIWAIIFKHIRENIE